MNRMCAASIMALCAAQALAAAEPSVRSGDLPLPDPGFTGYVGRTVPTSDPATPVRPATAPAGAPNIVVILIDDAGFAQFGTFGGAVPSPTLDALAADGLRYNRFHTAGVCSPTRAALLTGRNPHNAGFGVVAENANGYDGYIGFIPQSTAPVAEILQGHGYATAMFGKNHNTPPGETGPAGPFNHWPNAFGFDYFYGFNAWGTSQWQPLLYENHNAVPPSADPRYHLTADMADHAIRWARNVKAVDPEKPVFLYFATGATHAPHHAPREWIDRFKGQFDGGWDAYREQAFARQKKLGVIPADAVLTPRPPEVPAWDSLSPDMRHMLARQMEVMAGFTAHTEAQIGRLLQAIRAMPGGDNTLVMFVAGDNGASAEGGPIGSINELAPANGLRAETEMKPEYLDRLGGPDFNNNFPVGWAWAMNTPFQYYKRVASHLGAIRNPLVVSWPGHIRDVGGVRSQFLDVTDIAPTLLAAAGIAAPRMVDGVAQKPMDGVSMLPTFASATAPELRRRQYFEVSGNRAIYDQGWFASAKLFNPAESEPGAALDPDKVRWELYDLSKDFSQSRDLSASMPERTRAMQDLWWVEAARNNVLPLSWDTRGGKLVRPPEARTKVTFYPGLAGLPEKLAPNVRNRSWTLTATGDFTPADKGMIATQGGLTGGWALYLRDGRAVFDYNLAEAAHYRVTSDQPVPAGSKTIEMRFAYEGGEQKGAGGRVTFLADGKPIGTGHIERTLPNIFAVNEGMDVGADYGSPVGDYPMPFPFSGKLESVTFDLR